MSKGKRIVLFLITFVLLLVIFVLTYGHPFPTTNPALVLFTSLLMLSFASLFLEHFFTTPTHVLLSTISILLLISPIREELSRFGIWYSLFYAYNLLLLLTSLAALLLVDGEKASFSLQNRIASYLKEFSTSWGNGRFLFFLLFFLTLVFYVDSQSKHFLVLAAYATVILLVDPKTFVLGMLNQRKHAHHDIGEIIGVQSKNIFLAQLFTERVKVQRFDLVQFRYSMDEDQAVLKGMIIDNYLMNEKQWIKILSTDEMRKSLSNSPAERRDRQNVVCKLEEQQSPELFADFVGVVIEGSTIENIRFEYAEKVPICEGSLLEVSAGKTKLLYQVIQGRTTVETLESKNETGFIVGEAVQLGVWNPTRYLFEKYGWVPGMNTPVFLASKILPVMPAAGELHLGTIPNTNYPVLMNIADAITYHMAILGTTGCGKSVFTRDLVRKIIAQNFKVICVDFTNEYSSKFSSLKPSQIIAEEKQVEMFAAIEELAAELDKFPNQRNRILIAQKEKTLQDRFVEGITEFLTSGTSVALFELPDVSNTTGILEYTKWFFRMLFRIAKTEKNYGQRVCIVLEEAHTVIPEWNFIGVEEKKAQSLVNSIGQIALQGRKYGIGFIVIAQRTANVSKTVLTQCNSVIAFQQFDKTSGDFLANYMGTEMVQALPSLRFRQAVAVGKGFKTGAPVIFEVPDIQEDHSEPE
jgi:uncharacterized protein